jgi:hypothetical protein
MKHRLSPVLKEIADVIGRDAMTQLAIAFGGTRVYIPAKIGKGHPIAKAIGDTAAAKLADYFASTSLAKDGRRFTRRGQSVALPLAPNREKERLLCEDNLSTRAAALKHRVTERTIQRHRARAREAEAR